MGFFIFDLIVLIVLILAVIQGYRKGFVLTLCGFLAVFVAFIGASILSDALAGPVSQAITPAIESGIQDTVGSYYQYTPPVENSGDGSTPGDAFFDELPLEDVLAALQDSSLYRSLTQNFQQAVEDGVETVAANAVRALAEYVACGGAADPDGAVSPVLRADPGGVVCAQPRSGPGLQAAGAVHPEPVERGGCWAGEGRRAAVYRLLAVSGTDSPGGGGPVHPAPFLLHHQSVSVNCLHFLKDS